MSIRVQAVCNSLGMYNVSYCVWAGVCLSSIPTVCLWAAWPHYKALSLSTWVLPDLSVFSTTSPGPPPAVLAWAPQPGTLRTGPGTTMPPSFTSFKPWTGRDGAARQRPDARPAASDKQKPYFFCPALCFFFPIPLMSQLQPARTASVDSIAKFTVIFSAFSFLDRKREWLRHHEDD